MENFEKCTVAMLGGPCSQHVTGNTSQQNQPQSAIMAFQSPIYSVSTLRPRQNGHRFVDDVFKCIFRNENVWILLKISLKFVPNGLINNFPSLVQIMAWRRPGDKPLSEPMMVNLLTHICVTRPQWVKLMTICYARDHWKLVRSRKQLRLLWPPVLRNLPGTALRSGFLLNKTILWQRMRNLLLAYKCHQSFYTIQIGFESRNYSWKRNMYQIFLMIFISTLYHPTIPVQARRKH